MERNLVRVDAAVAQLVSAVVGMVLLKISTKMHLKSILLINKTNKASLYD